VLFQCRSTRTLGFFSDTWRFWCKSKVNRVVSCSSGLNDLESIEFATGIVPMCYSNAEVQILPVSFLTLGGSYGSRRLTVSSTVPLGWATSKTSDLSLELCTWTVPVLSYNYFRFSGQHWCTSWAGLILFISTVADSCAWSLGLSN
jgi:hypothetical protein